MKLLKRAFMPRLWIAMILAVLAGCQAEPTPELVAPPGAGIGVGITKDNCPYAEVTVGQQVAWTNQDDQEHVVRHKPVDGNPVFDSGTLQPGDSFTFTFTAAGDYAYECSSDGSLTGAITVGP